MKEMTLFDLLPEEQREKYRPKKSNDWKWSFADYPKEKNGIKVFSCFACGGGSTMGYKLAGCEVLGCCEIDPKMNEVYVANHHPKYNFLMDIRDFNALPDSEIPQELFNLDILDGSPPCTTFSMAGQREESWGKKKKFREGQKEQTLDDLSFVFIQTAKKLHPKVVIMENVEGLLLGEAFEYVRRIYSEFHKAGYVVNHWLLKGEKMGIPQARHRVFFVAIRVELDIDPQWLDMSFDYDLVPYGVIRDGIGRPLKEGQIYYEVAKKAIETDASIADTRVRLGEKNSGSQNYYARKDAVMQTMRAKPDYIDIEQMAYVSAGTLRNAQTFPQDYDFGAFSTPNVGYICGMSVPPVMMKRVVQKLIEQGVFSYKEKGVQHET